MEIVWRAHTPMPAEKPWLSPADVTTWPSISIAAAGNTVILTSTLTSTSSNYMVVVSATTTSAVSVSSTGVSATAALPSSTPDSFLGRARGSSAADGISGLMVGMLVDSIEQFFIIFYSFVTSKMLARARLLPQDYMEAFIIWCPSSSRLIVLDPSSS